MNISITFDVEVWCGGWDALDEKFPSAFQRYIFGEQGYALPKTLEILNRHGLTGVFFVEPLFAYRFGLENLQLITDLITDAGHEVQLHLHPEWVDETSPPLLQNAPTKRPYLHQYDFESQVQLIAKGVSAFESCGLPRPVVFRAGSYACNRQTFRALAKNEIYIDTSANFAYPGSAEDLDAKEKLLQPFVIDGISEYPVTTFIDGFGRPRHWQVGAVGYDESIQLIEAAAIKNYRHLVLVSHNFEMLVPGKSRVDKIVATRFEKLCSWLGERATMFPTTGFQRICDSPLSAQTITLESWPSAKRLSAQLARRLLSKF